MKDPAFLFYPNDYLGGTLGMTFEEKGAYIELLMVQFNRGHMTSHMIGQVLGQNMDKIWSTVKNKFKIDADGNYYNERLEIEQNKRKAFSDSRRNNLKGENQFTKKRKKTGHKLGHMTNHMENENRNENKDIIIIENKIDFEFFWNEYNKKVGDKKRCKKKWDKLHLEIQQKVLDSLPEFIKQFQDKQFQPHPETYLNQERWNDEIIIKNNNNGKGKQQTGASWDEISNMLKTKFTQNK